MPQRTRILIAAAYALGLSILSYVLTGDPLPPLGADGTWFYAGVATLLLSTALTEPFFTRPADALINGIAAVLVAVTFPLGAGATSGASRGAIESGKVLLLVYGGLVVAISLTAILTFNAHTRSRTSTIASHLSGIIGSARVVYSVVLLLSAYAVYSQIPWITASVVVAWIVIAVVRPLERLTTAGVFRTRPAPERVGEVVGTKNPGLAEVVFPAGMGVRQGSLVAAESHTGLVLDVAVHDDGEWALVSIPDESLPGLGTRVRVQGASPDASRLIGVVEPGTDIGEVRFRTPSGVGELREGSLVEVPLRGEDVLYQVVAGRLHSESITNPTQHRFVEAVARKIGTWDSTNARFRHVSWLPSAGEVVRLAPVGTAAFEAECIGCLPSSAFGVRLDMDSLVTHNTAILGILGIGKTYLSFEIIRRALSQGIRVVVLDVTSEYAKEFRVQFPMSTEDAIHSAIDAAISATRDTIMVSPQLGGNVNAFRTAIRGEMDAFMAGGDVLRVYNPASFDVTRQDSKVFANQAAIAQLTIAETTRELAEALLGALSSQMSSAARVLLVLEEAHSLVPEWNSTSYDGDQRASNGTAKAVLQGRKFGLGVLLITQRTANVTKTILNQCNTVFALRTFDATGMGFLRNYIGGTYADVLSGLQERTAVIFGKASSCENPVIIQLNNHDDVVEAFPIAISSGMHEGVTNDD